MSRTDASREFHVDDAALLKARLRRDVLLNFSSIQVPVNSVQSVYL